VPDRRRRTTGAYRAGVRVVVVGAGISGLTCALRLSEAGHDVTVVAARPPLRTTSAVAAALWYPYRALPREAVTRWSAITFQVLLGLLEVPGAGVRMRTGRELFRQEQPDPWWRDAVPALDRVPAAELPPGYRDGYLLRVPVVATSVHLPWLVSQLGARGVQVQDRELTTLTQAGPDAEVVVDCTGLGAAQLAGDQDLVPVRGQVVVVEQTGVEQWLLAQSDPDALTYVVPRERTVVLGGTAQVGASSTEPDPATADAVVARCTELVPALRSARVLEHRAGLRPTRPSVRLEVGELEDGRPVVHDYGHGGAGVTLSYGCAADVVHLVESCG
jgi:D-amino-acid oxidase